MKSDISTLLKILTTPGIHVGNALTYRGVIQLHVYLEGIHGPFSQLLCTVICHPRKTLFHFIQTNVIT